MSINRTKIIVAMLAGLGVCMATSEAMGALEPVGSTLKLGTRYGGFMHDHKMIADRWLRRKVKIEFSGKQESAAGIQLLYFKRMGGNVCYRGNAKLGFHLANSRGYLHNNLKPFIGKANTALVGPLSISMKYFPPSLFKFKRCD